MDVSEETFGRVYETARALGEETRFRIFQQLCREAPAPVSVSELAEGFSLHPNAIRQHLTRLEQAGLITSRAHREGGAGRPRRLYVAAPGGLRIGAARRTPGMMLSMLEEAVDLLPADRDQLVAFGRAWGQTWVRRRRRETGFPRSRRGRVDLLAAELTIWGWEPTTRRENGVLQVETGRCLFRRGSPRGGRSCALEEGVLGGLVEGIINGGGRVALDGCRLAVADRA